MRAGVIFLSALWLFLTAPGSVFSWQWPVKPVEIAGGFAGDTPDGFRNGVFLRGAGVRAGSVADGQVIFTDRRDQRSGSLPSGLGDFVVVEHAQSFRSVYAHLKPGSLPAGMKQVAEGQWIGTTGESGRVDTPGLVLRIIDMKSDRSVNPLVLLPPVEDRRSPTIQNIMLSDRTEIQLEDGTTVGSAHWAVDAEVFDEIVTNAGRFQVAPYGIDLSVNDKTVSSIRFMFLEFRQGKEYIDQRYRWSFDNLYLSRHTYNLGLVDLSPGINTIRISAYDFAGNRTEVTRQVYFGQEPAPVASPTAPTPGAAQGTAQ
jgi:murein DD-endopeptidase MepM/ murein hydrolase activator NlpD